ncbi:MAG: sugar ABC transporter permease, partial [Oscillospiraceae bacterium]|nr:sugar ABC transporter permease [Oscillospiraceae bacterium]
QKIPKFWLRAAIILPLVIPAASVSMIFNILVADGGGAQKFLMLLGMEEASILHSPAAFYALVVFYLWKNIGYTVILFLAGLNAIPKEYAQAASIDGANGAQILRYITIPRIAPTAFLVFIIAIIRTFSSFREAYLLAGNYPHTSIYMLQHFMQNNFAALNYQRLSVAALLVFAVIFLLVWVIYRLRNRMED